MSRVLQIAGLITASVGLGIEWLWVGITFAGVASVLVGVALEIESRRVR